MKIKQYLLALAFTGIFFTGCGNEGKAELPQQTTQPVFEETTDIKEAVPTYSGSINLSMRRPATLNPILNRDVSVDKILKLVFEPLFVIDDNLNLIPNLAEDFNVSSDGRSATLRLRSDACWSDGSDVTVQDFIYTIETLASAPDDAVYKSCIDDIAMHEIIDNKTIRLEFNQHFSGRPYLYTFPLIPKHYYRDKSDSDMNPMGNGAYEFASYTETEGMLLSVSESSYKKPYIQEIKVNITGDNETDLYAFDQGVIDAVASNLATWVKYKSSKEAVVHTYNTTYYDFIGFNYDNPVFQNKDIRTAVAHCVNREEYKGDIYLGNCVIANTPVNPSSWVYEENTVSFDFNTSKASELFSKLSDDEKEIRLLVNSENEERIKISQYLKEDMEAAGIKLIVEALPFEEYLQKLELRDYDMFIGGFNLSPFPDLTFMLHSSSIGTGSNYFAYSNPEMDILLANVFYASNDISIKNSLSSLQKFIAEEVVCVSICFRQSAVLTDEKIKCETELTPYSDNIFYNIDKWFIY